MGTKEVHGRYKRIKNKQNLEERGWAYSLTLFFYGFRKE